MRGYHAHGFLMLVLVGHLLWLDRECLSRLHLQPLNAFGALALAACSAVWLLSWGVDYMPGEIAGFFVVWLLGVCLMFGWQGILQLGPKLGLLIFSIPMWYSLTPVLQSLSTFAVERLLHLTSLTAFVEGNFILVPTGTIEIAGGCSGISYLLASLSFIGYVVLSERLNWRGGGVFLAAAVLLALLANWVRIFIIILFGYFYGLEHPLVSEHVMFGWVLFGVLFAPFIYGLFWLLARYPSLSRAAPDSPETSKTNFQR